MCGQVWSPPVISGVVSGPGQLRLRTVCPAPTTQVYPDLGRSTFSPPDTLRDSVALFLQVATLLSLTHLKAADSVSAANYLSLSAVAFLRCMTRSPVV